MHNSLHKLEMANNAKSCQNISLEYISISKAN